MESSWLHRYAVLLSVCTLFLLVAGATVTSKEAGLSVPDWPLSYGQVMPPMTGGVFFEHGHRMAGAAVGMLTIGLAIWLWRVEKRAWMRRLGWILVAWVTVVGLLGGLTVKLLTPPPVSILHTCLAQLFFSTTVCVAVFTSRRWFAGPELVDDYGRPSIRSLAVITPALVLMQIALGAAFRQRALGVMPHIIGAMVVSLTILLLGVFVLHAFPDHRTLRPAALAMLGITFLQVFLGVGAYLGRLQADQNPGAMVFTTVAHLAVGALTLASSIVLAIHIRRNVRLHAAETADSPHAAVTS
jgi:cytochrome c oxidase assembly protein subunit 15